ncbi:MAG: DUF554 domain-containing protein [Anaerolineaceae bacterium]|nr:DUF554 domain-containing protein [Anaerolineaceae bacterium]
MPIGIIVNSIAIVLGGVAGGVFGRHIPEHIRTAMPRLIGLASFAMAIYLLRNIVTLPAVIRAVILGAVAGEALDIEGAIAKGSRKLRKLAERDATKAEVEDDLLIGQFISILVLFCAGSSGIIGVLTEGITGDTALLFSKSILDFFVSIVFGTSVGFLISFIAIPQFFIFMALFGLSRFIMPVFTDAMTGDFLACGGVISMAAALRLSEIKPIKVSNLLPVLLFSIPVSWAWSLL